MHKHWSLRHSDVYTLPYNPTLKPIFNLCQYIFPQQHVLQFWTLTFCVELYQRSKYTSFTVSRLSVLPVTSLENGSRFVKEDFPFINVCWPKIKIANDGSTQQVGGICRKVNRVNDSCLRCFVTIFRRALMWRSWEGIFKVTCAWGIVTRCKFDARGCPVLFFLW